MSKKILVIGGTYFLGRVFTILASREGETSLTLVNRGKFSMANLPGVKEYSCDRHNAAGLQALPIAEDVAYDAIVDFCAYEPGDIQTVLENLPCKAKQYIFISTADVYDRSIRTPKDESTPLQSERSDREAGDYMYNKMLLEKEADKICAEKGIPLTILRPAFIYGPYNYAPRESYYVKKIVNRGPVPEPIDSDAQFQFVYVKDAAQAVLSCAGNELSYGKAYNLAAPEVITYEKYMSVLAQVSDISFETLPVTVSRVLEDRIPLPFPLREAESELFIGEKITSELGLNYTPFKEGMQKTFKAFKNVFQS